jgi:hypothetical protein
MCLKQFNPETGYFGASLHQKLIKTNKNEYKKLKDTPNQLILIKLN